VKFLRERRERHKIVAQSICSRNASRSLCNRISIALQSIRKRCEIALWLLQNCCIVNSQSLDDRCKIVVQSLRYRRAITVIVLDHCPFADQSLLIHYLVALQLLRNRHAMGFKIRCGIAAQSIRNRRKVAANAFSCTLFLFHFRSFSSATGLLLILLLSLLHAFVRLSSQSSSLMYM
jgi:hypothetical protein